jgi:nucleoside-diphosphate-sugar epimerase
MKTILITGGAGYIGTELTIALLEKHKVIVYDKFFFPWLKKNKKNIKNNDRLTFVKKNIIDVKKKDLKNVDIICDLAAVANDPSCELNKRIAWKINYFGRLKFAKIAKASKVKQYIFNSSCSVYGANKNKVYENSSLNPVSTYAKSILKCEQKIYKLRDKNFKTYILRNGTVFGNSRCFRLDLVINFFTYRAALNNNLIVDGDGKQFRPFISVKDLINIFIYIIKNVEILPSFICNLVSFNSNILDIARKIKKVLKSNVKIEIKKYIDIDKRNYNVGSKYFKKFFGNRFKFKKLNSEIKSLDKFYKNKKTKIDLNSAVRFNFYKKYFSLNRIV